MPAPLRKILIFAAVDGLILQPASQRKNGAIHIKYATQEISSLGSSPHIDPQSSVLLESHGIVGSTSPCGFKCFADNASVKGLLTVAPIAYLITILKRQQIAQVRGSPIYVISDIALIPLSSRSEASKAIRQAKESLKKDSGEHGAAAADIDTSDYEEAHVEGDRAEDHYQVSAGSLESPTKDGASGARPVGPQRSSSSVAEDVGIFEAIFPVQDLILSCKTCQSKRFQLAPQMALRLKIQP